MTDCAVEVESLAVSERGEELLDRRVGATLNARLEEAFEGAAVEVAHRSCPCFHHEASAHELVEILTCQAARDGERVGYRCRGEVVETVLDAPAPRAAKLARDAIEVGKQVFLCLGDVHAAGPPFVPHLTGGVVLGTGWRPRFVTGT